MATLEQFLAVQNSAVLAAFCDDAWDICAAVSRAALDQQAAKAGCKVGDLKDWPPADAAIVHHDGHAELWLRAKLAAYDKPFFAFAHRHTGFSAEAVPGWEVDHLFSHGRVRGTTPRAGDDPEEEARKLAPATLVRMVLVKRSINRSFGRLMEGAMIGTGNPDRPVRRFTWLQLAKALSIDANLHKGGFAGRQRLANFGHVLDCFVRHGVPDGIGLGKEQILASLIMQADTVVAYRRRAKQRRS
jgi:hypothetical protein